MPSSILTSYLSVLSCKISPEGIGSVYLVTNINDLVMVFENQFVS